MVPAAFPSIGILNAGLNLGTCSSVTVPFGTVPLGMAGAVLSI